MDMDLHAYSYYSEESTTDTISNENHSVKSFLFANNFYVTSVHERAKDKVVTQFGKPDENYHWIECQSKRYPGKKYYYNLRTFCSTWIRPVSRYVNVPQFYPYNKIADEQSVATESFVGVSEINYPSTRRKKVVHDIDDQNQELIEGKREIFKRFYGSIDICESNEEETLDTEPKIRFPDSLEYWENWCFASPRGHQAGKTIVLTEEFDETEDINDDEILLNNNNNDYDFSTESSCPCCSRNANFVVPRLKKIESSDLLIKPSKIRKTRQKTKKKTEKDIKIVCDMYGTTTINYNQSDLDEIVYTKMDYKVTNLSDTNTEYSLQTRNLDRNNAQRFVLNISSPNLSEITEVAPL